MAYEELAATLSGSTWLIVAVALWEVLWNGIAMWKSARRGHIFWFVIFLLVNLLGIPEIIYLIVTRKKSVANRMSVGKVSSKKKKRR